MGESRLIVFVRYPVAGKVKTRLIPALGEDGAAALSREMAEHTMNWASRLAGKGGKGLEIRFEGGLVRDMEAWLGKGFRYVPQGDGDVGARMDRAFREAFSEGIGKAVLIGTDLPELTVFHIREAWKALDAFDVVLGPAADGGYGPIGLRRAVPDLFRGISWSTDRVLKQTLAKAAAACLKVKILPALCDVDRPDDIPVWERTVRKSMSIIIPTLNEEGHFKRTLCAVGRPADTEVIIADAGSRDDTLTIAEEFGAKIVSCRPSRG
ncbi:MAG: TIGR04282 family arsenosugar biosynthesis glycosyltransferase, partial [Candidatus Aminicenantes bacterium]|nr:TIGR04282 family arsenosugar biosynthesis glycosyltransferase [Candidatus Aminicenantes bacterium]